MGIASMVIGIIAAILGFIPICGAIAFIPAVIGLVLGLVDFILKGKSKKPRGMGLAGVILNAVAIIVIVLWIFVFASAANDAKIEIDNIKITPPTQPVIPTE
ncbi:MAG TPA: hypothetical protein ENL03_05590 [Phycisphaerae bacterium]|nr:hypothetical protein [Phycisphaerae bacterium]